MNPVRIDAHDLAQAIRSGDPARRNQAFKQLYLSPAVNGKLREWANTYNLRNQDPDDVLQEALILLDKLVCEGGFRAESKVETFLLGICRNMIRDNAKKVQRVVLKETLPETVPDSAEGLADHLELQELTEAGSRRDAALGSALAQLTEKCRDALRLYYYERRSMAEIAEARELANEKQAKKAVHRCREQLRQRIEGDPALHHLIN